MYTVVMVEIILFLILCALAPGLAFALVAVWIAFVIYTAIKG
jgi:hypothetical protein